MAASTLQFVAQESVDHDTETCKDVQRDELLLLLTPGYSYQQFGWLIGNFDTKKRRKTQYFECLRNSPLKEKDIIF